jgi:hypothetical protein
MPRGRPMLGERPMTATERSTRRHQRQREREKRYEETLCDLLEIAEFGTITPEYVAQKCREALGVAPHRSAVQK